MWWAAVEHAQFKCRSHFKMEFRLSFCLTFFSPFFQASFLYFTISWFLNHSFFLRKYVCRDLYSFIWISGLFFYCFQCHLSVFQQLVIFFCSVFIKLKNDYFHTFFFSLLFISSFFLSLYFLFLYFFSFFLSPFLSFYPPLFLPSF